MGDETLEEIRADLDTLAERLGDAAYDSLRAQLHRGAKPAKTDPDLVARSCCPGPATRSNAPALLVAQAERTGGAGAEEPGD